MSAIDAARREARHLTLLDGMLPRLDRLEVGGIRRPERNVPILMLTACGQPAGFASREDASVPAARALPITAYTTGEPLLLKANSLEV